MSNRVWVRKEGKFVTVIESFEELKWTRRYNRLGTLFMRVNRNVDGAQFLVGSLGDEISVIDTPGATVPDLTFVIEAPTFRIGEGGLSDDIVEVRGVEAGLFHARIALPPPHSLPLSGTDSHHVIDGDAETAMLEIVDKNVGPSAPSDRQFPHLVIAANQNRGKSKKWKARFETVEEKLNAWSQESGLGFEVTFDASANEHTFTVLQGVDVSDKVEFSLRLDNAKSQEWKINGSDQVSFAYVAGQGEGTARSVDSANTGSSIPTGKDRREMFVDARDIDAELESRGDEKLADRVIDESFDMEITDGVFQYRTDWDLGDTVAVRNDVWNFAKNIQIVAVETEVKDDEIRRSITLGKPPKGLRARILDDIGDQATARQ